MRPAMRRGRNEDLRLQPCFCIQVTYAPAMRPARAEPAAILEKKNSLKSKCYLSLFIITPMRRDYAPREVSRRTPPAHSMCEFYKYGYAPDPMRRETLSGATPGA